MRPGEIAADQPRHTGALFVSGGITVALGVLCVGCMLGEWYEAAGCVWALSIGALSAFTMINTDQAGS